MRPLWRELFTGLGGDRAPQRHHVLAGKVRLLAAVPVILGPTGVILWGVLDRAYAPAAARTSLVAWTAAVLAYVVVNLPLAFSRSDPTGEPTTAARALTYAAVTFELLTNQLSTYGSGTFTSNGAVYLVLLVAIYRVFFDFRLGLYATLLGVGLFVLTGTLEVARVIPSAPLHDLAPTHLIYRDARATVTLLHEVVAGVLITFVAINYGVNQSVKLHRYITESVLRRYLPPALVARAARGELRLDAEPERRVVTVLFLDLVGFTALSEREGPDRVAHLLNRCLSRLADVAHAHGATVDKFIGDAIMVVFGTPEPLAPEEQARRCVALAQAWHEEIPRLDGDVPLRARCGVNTGDAIVGNFGSLARSDYTVIGPTVNVAARLEAACQPGRILMGPETARLLGDRVPLEPAGALTLRGVAAPVEAFYVATPGAAATAPAAPAP